MQEVKDMIAARRDEIQTKRDQTRKLHFGDAPGWNLEKSLKTRTEKYGCAWNQQAVKRTKFLLHGDPNWNNPRKNFKTKLENGTTNTSKSEEASYVMLAERFGRGDVLRQYRSEEYPFACDFYVRSRNMYVECNYCWTHGGHWFDPYDQEDVEKLQRWKSKGTGYYLNAIDTWTRRDTGKRLAARAAKLNYWAFWRFDDFCVWLENSTF